MPDGPEPDVSEPAGPAPPAGHPGTDPVAVIGLVCAVFVPLVGLVLSLVALRRTASGARGGRGVAVVGTVIGGLLTLLWLVVSVLLLVGLARAAQGVGGIDVEGLGIDGADLEGIDPESAIESAEAELAEEAARANLPDEVVAVGETAQVGEYTLTVAAVTTDAGARVAAESPSTGPAEGQYVVVDVTATYEGAGQGTLWLELDATYVGGDASAHPTADCTGELPGDPFDAPALRSGDTAEVTYCFDVPPAAAAGGVVVLGPPFDPAEEERVGWQVA